MTHLCHAKDCAVVVEPRLLMCARHWRMVPADLRAAVLATYRKGQEIDKRPSKAYARAARAAINAVAALERRRGACDHEWRRIEIRDHSMYRVRIFKCASCGKRQTTRERVKGV